MDQNKRNKITIILIIIAFLSPVILSWWYLNFTNVVEEGGKSNNGDLIIPPRTIENLDLLDPLAEERDYELYGKWSMVYITPVCDEVCVENLYRMRQLHIAMDKHSLRVQRVLFLTEPVTQNLKELFKMYEGQRIIQTQNIDINGLLDRFRLKQADDPLKANRIYIIDPLGNLMMSYEPEINPRGIMKDLQKLLKASRIG